MAGRGVRRRGLLEVPLPGGSRVVREPVVPAVLPRPGVGSVRRTGAVGRVGAVRRVGSVGLLRELVALLLVCRVRVVPLGAVDGRAGHRPRARGGRVGSGGRGGVDRNLRRYVAVAGRGEGTVGGQQGVDAPSGSSTKAVAPSSYSPWGSGSQRLPPRGVPCPCWSSVTTAPSPVLVGPARRRCAAGAVRRAEAAVRSRPRRGPRRGCRPRRRTPRRRSAPPARSRGCCPSR